jgi:hypothetical protein
MKKMILLLIVFAGMNVVLADSFYSSIGLGLPHHNASTRSIGMGSASLAVVDRLALNSLNPAAINIKGATTVCVDFQLESADIKNEETKINTRDGNAAGFRFALPLKKTITLITGLKPHLSSKYTLSIEQTFDDIDYTRKVEGNGGLNSAVLGLSYNVTENLVIASLAHFYFGSYNEEWFRDFESSFYRDGEVTLTSHVRGMGAEFGLFANPVKNLGLGMVYKTQSDLSIETTLDLGQFYSSTEQDMIATLPRTLGLGASYQVQKVLFAADFYSQFWSQYKLEGKGTDELTDYWRIGGGVEYLDTDNPFADYFRRNSFRLGLYFAQLPFKNPAGSSINEKFVSIGMGLPFHRNAGRIDFALEFGIRGDASNDLYQENIVRFNCSIMGSELWFQRRPH